MEITKNPAQGNSRFQNFPAGKPFSLTHTLSDSCLLYTSETGGCVLSWRKIRGWGKRTGLVPGELSLLRTASVQQTGWKPAEKSAQGCRAGTSVRHAGKSRTVPQRGSRNSGNGGGHFLSADQKKMGGSRMRKKTICAVSYTHLDVYKRQSVTNTTDSLSYQAEDLLEKAKSLQELGQSTNQQLILSLIHICSKRCSALRYSSRSRE